MIARFVHIHLEFLQKNPNLIKLFLREIHSNNPIVHKVLKELYADAESEYFKGALTKFRKAIKEGQLRPVDPMQTLWNLVGLDLFYFVARPVLNIVWHDKIQDEAKILRQREKSIVDLLLYGLLPRNE